MDLHDQSKEDLIKIIRSLEKQSAARHIRSLSGDPALVAVSRHVAHDLKAPARQMRQLSEMLGSSSGMVNDEDQALISMIADRSVQMDELIEEVRSYCESYIRPLHLEQVNLPETAEAVLSRIAKIDKHIHIISSDCHPIEADPFLVESFFHNLLKLLFIFPNSSFPIDMEIKSEYSNTLKFSIEMNFSEYPVETTDESNFFAPYSSIDINNIVINTGLKLASCQTVCFRHGWTISVEFHRPSGIVIKLHL